MRNRSIGILLAALLSAGSACFAQQAIDTVAPLRANQFTDQVYVGFDHTRTDYALATSDGNEVATTNGVDIEYLPFGSARSTYWSVGSGVLYHFGRAR